MEIHGKVHLFFEQSGVWKREFLKLGIPAFDYDLLNNFGETDHQIDLFKEIEKAYDHHESIVDSFSTDDVIIAFFPCIYFSQQNSTFFDGTWMTYKQRGMTEAEINQSILERSQARQHFYEVALKMFTVFSTRGLRLIVENPYSSIHYLVNNFPYKPKYIDKNRRLRGDYFAKPTQYWFVNCEPSNGFTYQKPKETKNVNVLSGHQGSYCDEDRSLIAPEYAHNFIVDNILGKAQNLQQLSLF